jgi:murein DD-endopeptidase MepM/ murein hydrolase activator NlpD
MSKNNSRNEFLGRGYYIALLCAAAIGLCGFLYYRSTNNEPLRLSDPDTTVSATVSGGDVQAIAGRPETLTPDGSAATTAPAPSEKPALKTAAPVEGQTVAVFSVDALSYNQTTRDWRTHDGVDIAAEAGTKVCAAADGEVYTVYEDDTLGTTVVIRHAGGYVTKYASLAEAVTVAPGEQVKMGQPIGAVGCSALLENSIGDHVHFSVTCNDEPVDPAVFLKQG